MKDFINFLEFLSNNENKIAYDLAFGLEDVPKSQQTISKDEWLFIQKFSINAAKVILQQYHNWLNQDTYE